MRCFIAEVSKTDMPKNFNMKPKGQSQEVNVPSWQDQFESDPVWQGVQARLHEVAKNADDGRKRKIELALQLANHLLNEYKEDKQKFRDEQSPKVNRLLRQFKSTYESNYDAELFVHERREYLDEIKRQCKVFNLPLPEDVIEYGREWVKKKKAKKA